jgi:putative endonuclease
LYICGIFKNLLIFLVPDTFSFHPEMMHYVYVLKSVKLGELYIGQTNDLKRRFVEHNTGESISTKHKAPFKLVYYEAYQSKSDAKYREKQLKRHAGATIALKRRIKNSFEM